MQHGVYQTIHHMELASGVRTGSGGREFLPTPRKRIKSNRAFRSLPARRRPLSPPPLARFPLLLRSGLPPLPGLGGGGDEAAGMPRGMAVGTRRKSVRDRGRRAAPLRLPAPRTAAQAGGWHGGGGARAGPGPWEAVERGGARRERSDWAAAGEGRANHPPPPSSTGRPSPAPVWG